MYPTIKAVMQRFSVFLASLPIGDSPVYLVAHNGRGFDFRILESEVVRSEKHLCVNSLEGVDSIDAFRYYAKTEGVRWSSFALDTVSRT